MKPSVTIPEKSQFIGSPCEPAFHGHFRPHSNQYMIYYAKTKFKTSNQPWQSRLLLLGFKNSYQFGPKVWDRSNGPSRPHSTQTFVKYLKREQNPSREKPLPQGVCLNSFNPVPKRSTHEEMQDPLQHQAQFSF